MNGRVVIVDDEPITKMDLRGMLEASNYKVVAEASDGLAAIEECKLHQPDLVLMDIKMPLLDGLKASKHILENKLAKAIVLLTSYSDQKYIERAQEYGVTGYLVKPVDERSLVPTLAIALATGQKQQKLVTSCEKLETKLEDRKKIERAKGILMSEENLNEEQSYQLMRKLSMNRRCPIIDIANMLLIGSE